MTSTITHSGGAYSNTSPIAFNISFDEALLSPLLLSHVNISGGTLIKISGGGSAWTVEANPASQGGTVSIQIPGGVVNGAGGPNNASNPCVVSYNTIRPIPVITHSLPAVTDSQSLFAKITFDREVSGFNSSDITVKNCVVKDFNGSGANYNITLQPIKVGEIEFSVVVGAAIDNYGNQSVHSNEIRLFYDASSFDEKSQTLGGDVTDPNVLLEFKIDELKQVAAINSLADCAKNIPQRLLGLAEEKAFEILSSNPTVKKLVGGAAIIQSSIKTIQELVDNVQSVIDHPETLLEAVLASQGLTGEALRLKMAAIADKFSAVSGLDNIISTINTSGICGQTNYTAGGTALPQQTVTPSANPPPSVPGVSAPVTTTYNPVPKDNYDTFLFNLKEFLEIDSSQEQSPDRAAMISMLTTLAMGYHDDVAKTTDSSKDSELFGKYNNNVSNEKTKNVSWDEKIKSQFAARTTSCGEIINRNCDVIRAFMNRNKPITGTTISVGVTTYSGPDKDFTTFLDIKPSQRPAELTNYWSGKYNISSQEAKLNGRGIKTGTLNYSDAYNGAYGGLVSDMTVASSRFPGGSIIALRNSDGTPYNPSSKNPSGQFKVTDTGNAKLTYAKPDIFTSTPELYKNTESVQVTLVSEGAQRGKQYLLAQSKYGSGSKTA